MPYASDPWIQSLAPPDPAWKGLGGSELISRPSDWPMILLPHVADALPKVFAPTTMAPFFRQAYDQGQTGACVAASSSGLSSIDGLIDQNRWQMFDWRKVYTDNGGTGQNGVDSRQVLEYLKNNGTPLLNGAGSVKVVGSYLFAPRVPGAFRQTLQAALTARQPFVVALLLPQNFGWDSGGAVTSGYHQVEGLGGDDTWCEIGNSWGDNWGQAGRGRIAWDYLEASNLQNGYCYAYTVSPIVLNPQPNPNPNPPPPPPPPPPGQFGFAVQPNRYGALAVVIVKLVGPQGQALSGIVTLTVGGQSFRHIAYSTRPAVFIVQQPAGAGYTLSATAGALSATASGVLP